MKHTLNRLPKNVIEITFELSPEEVQPYLDDAAKRISEAIKTPGFRPGHAPYNEIEKKVGAQKILEEALEQIVRKSYVEVVLAEQLETVGSPAVDVKKIAPGNPLIFKTTVSLMPNITKLVDYKTISFSQKPVTVTDEELNQVISDLQKMQIKETRSNRALEKKDRAVVDLSILQNKVPIEGGVTSGHSVIMDEPYYIPGFTDAILGMKEGEEKTFTLNFPTEHYQKNLAGKPADFSVKMKEVYVRELPTIDDSFAKNLGKPTLIELKNLLRENITKDKTLKEDERAELDFLNKIIDQSQFDAIPDLLVNDEINRMRHELEKGVAEQGLEWKDYLTQIKKSEAELKLEFTPQAIRRIKTMLVLRTIAKEEKIAVDEKEIDNELDRIASYYKDDQETRDRVYSPEYRDYTGSLIKHRKTITKLREGSKK